MSDVVTEAQRLADDVLFPAAIETDRSRVLPRELLDALADAGLYGLGAEADFDTTCAVFEALSSGCLTTTFVWAQHLGAVHTVVSEGSPELQAAWLDKLAGGTVRAGLALGGLHEPPTLHARAADGGWLLNGYTPWISGWGRIDVVHASARTDDARVLWMFVDAGESARLSVRQLDLVALNATASVRADFDDVFVPAERTTFLDPVADAPPPPNREVPRLHAAFALGVIARCCRLLGPSAFDEQVAALRAELDAADAEAMIGARAAASELALRVSAALVVSTGSRSLARTEHAQRLAREALFLALYANPAGRAALLERLFARGA